MDIDAVADRLYGLDPAEFTAARDAAAAEQSEAQARRSIKALRRPTAAAHAVNRLVRDRGDEVDELIALGDELRRAMQDDPVETRRLTEQRRSLVEALISPELPAGVQQEVTATLEAATADPELAAAVRSGRLVKPLRYAGFGAMPDLDDAVATPVNPRPGTAGRRKEPRATGPAAEKSRPRATGPDSRELARLRARVLELAGAADDAQRRYDEAVRAAQQARAALDTAEEERADAHRAARAAHAAAEKARRELGRLERS